MPPRFVIAVAALTVAAAATLATLAAAGPDRATVRSGFFNSPCEFTHRAMNDPIVFPGDPGASHSHDFFGNKSVDANSTLASLSAAKADCARPQDHAGYWVPTLYKGRRVVPPVRANVYYRTAARVPETIEPFPGGLRVVAGDPGARRPQDPRIVRWGCSEDAAPATVGGRPLCPRGTRLRLTVFFPDCWNGLDLDSADHRSHLAYALRGGGVRACPPSHPRAVPSIALNVPFNTRGGRGLRLASGSMNTAHADFFNAWDVDELARLVRECLAAAVNCDPPPPTAR